MILALAGGCFAASLAPASAADSKSTLLGVSKDWSAYQATTGDGKVCYALSKPKTIEPTKVSRDPIYLLVSDWPGRKVKGEFEVVPGYPYKDGEPAIAQVGSVKVELFTRNDGTSGSAWVKDPGDEDKLREAMRKGSTLTISGVSQRGTKTKDTYSLSGISAMLDKVHATCSK
ncbi:MAG TPA: invasion associated locus B family protein [Rhizomicrobium sp.]